MENTSVQRGLLFTFRLFPLIRPGLRPVHLPRGGRRPPGGGFYSPGGGLQGKFNFPTGWVGKRRAFSQKNPNIFRKNFSFFFGTRKNAENLAHLCKKRARRPVSVRIPQNPPLGDRGRDVKCGKKAD